MARAGDTDTSRADRGVEKVVEAIAKHREHLREHIDPAREAERRTREFVEVLSSELEERAIRAVADGGVASVVSEVKRGDLNPYSAVRRVIEDRKSLDELLLGSNANRIVAAARDDTRRNSKITDACSRSETSTDVPMS